MKTYASLVFMALFSSAACGGRSLDVGTAHGNPATSTNPSSPSSIVTVQDGDSVTSMAADETNLYVGTVCGFVHPVPRTGGSPTMLLAGTQYDGDIATDEQPPVNALAVDGDYVYVASRSFTQVVRVPKRGGQVEVLADHVQSSGRFVMDTAAIYVVPYVDPKDAASILRIPKSGGATTVIARDQPSITAITLSETEVYFAAGAGVADGSIRGVGKAGGPVRVIASDVDTRGRTTISLLGLVENEIAFVEPLSNKLSFVPIAGGPIARTAETTVVDTSLAAFSGRLFGIVMPEIERTDVPMQATLVRLGRSGLAEPVVTWLDDRPTPPAALFPAAVVTVAADGHVYWADNDLKADNVGRWTIRTAAVP